MARDGKTSRPGSTVAVEEGAPLFCPSAQPGMRDPVVIGVVEQDGAQDRRIAYLEQAIPYDEKVAALSGAVDPGKVMRIAARCEETRCAHFDGSRCSLVSRIRDLLPEAAVKAPPCAIRSACRWFA